MGLGQNERNRWLAKLERASDRWRDAGTARKRLNAARAGVALVQEAYFGGMASCRPGGSTAIDWEERLAEAEGRPRSFPPREAYCLWTSHKPLRAEAVIAAGWIEGVRTHRVVEMRMQAGLD